jgi:hypothetical protein
MEMMHVTTLRDQVIWEKHTQHSDALPHSTGSTLILLEPDIHTLTPRKLRNIGKSATLPFNMPN